MTSQCKAKGGGTSSCPSCHGREPLRSTCGLCGGTKSKKKEEEDVVLSSSCGSGREDMNVAEDLLATPELGLGDGSSSQCRACRRRAALIATSTGNFCSMACSKAHMNRDSGAEEEEEQEEEDLNSAMSELLQLSTDIEEMGEEEGKREDSSLYDIFSQEKNFGSSSLVWYGGGWEKQERVFTFRGSGKSVQMAYTTQGTRGPVVLLIPALGIHRSEFSAFQTLLSPFCRTLAIDPLNTGESSRLEKGQLHLLKLETELIQQLLDSLFRVRPALNVVGSEWGGVLGIQLAQVLGAQVQSLALLNPVPEMRGGKSQKMIALERCKGFLESIIQRATTASATASPLMMMGDCKLYEARIKEELGNVSLPSTPHYDPHLVNRAHALQNVSLLPRHLSANPGGVSLKIPVLFAYGQHADPPTDAVAQSLPAQYGLKQYEVQEICKARHLPALDQPRRTAQCYLHFLKGVAQQPVSDAYLGYPTSFKGDEPAIVQRLLV